MPILAQPEEHNIHIYQDRDFSKRLTLTDTNGTALNIIDWSFKSQIRPVYGSDELIAEFTISVDETNAIVLMSLTDTTTRSITGNTSISLTSTVTASNYVWDLVATDISNNRFSILQGTATFHKTSTRD